MADSKEKKVMDVAKPGEAKADIGSKPMIIGHKSLAVDPMVKDSSAETSTSTNAEEVANKPTEEKILPPSQRQKTIAQIEENMGGKKASSDVEKTEKKIEPVSASENLKSADAPKKSESESTEESKSTDNNSSDSNEDEAQNNDKKAEIDPVAVELEKQEETRKLIESKKYFVSIKQARPSNTKSLVIVLILVVVAGLLTLFYMLDTKKLDLGFELPFHLFSDDKQETTTSQPETLTTDELEQAPVDAEQASQTVPYLNQEFGISLEYPAGWGDINVEQINGYKEDLQSEQVPSFLNVTFSRLENVSLRIMNGRAIEGGKDFFGPSAEVDYFLTYLHAGAFKFSSTAEGYVLTRSDSVDASKDLTTDPLLPSIYDTSVAGTSGDVLIIQPKWDLENLKLLPWDTAKWTQSQQETEAELTAYNKNLLFVRNKTTEKMLGINAAYSWANGEKDQAIIDQLLNVIISIK
ncbi:MAG TPA: hypothetical protein PKD20_00460 [Candidatus Saccharibacteria bacterium]|jgi:hypothetical protein|nr:hypothetical protein [Candidatus Saccharibacteria bacterium]